MQLGLDFLDNGDQSDKRKSLISCRVADLSHSHFNPRINRDIDQVKKLAERIKRNGYEITRALWVYEEEDEYKVFAGGTRLEAAKLIDLHEVPAILHSGFSEDEIVKLSSQDNENDEYHEPLNCVEVWTSYKALAGRGWSQDRIAKAKGVTQSFVAYRLQCANLPESVKEYFIKKDFLKEGHSLELLKLSIFDNLSPWLDKETAMQEMICVCF